MFKAHTKLGVDARRLPRAGFPTLLLLLHVRPRQLAAGLEVAVYSGRAEDEEGGTACMCLDAPVFAVPRTQAGMERFVANLIAASPAELSEEGPATLNLPTKHSSWDRGWMSVQLDLLPPAEVQGTRQVCRAPGCVCHDVHVFIGCYHDARHQVVCSGRQPHRPCIRFAAMNAAHPPVLASLPSATTGSPAPSYFPPPQAGVADSYYLEATLPRVIEDSTFGRATVRNHSYEYAEQQESLKRRIEEQRKREQASPGSGGWLWLVKATPLAWHSATSHPRPSPSFKP